MSRPARVPGRCGAGLLEMALVLPLVVLMLVALADFARVFNALITLQRAVDDSANYATQWKSAGEFPSPGEVQSRLKGAILPPLDPNQVIINTLTTSSPDSTGQWTVVEDISYDVQLYTPLLSSLWNEQKFRVTTHARLAYPQFGAFPQGGGASSGATPPTTSSVPPAVTTTRVPATTSPDQ